MRIAIAGAGNVGRSIAQELIENGHQVMLIERDPNALRPERVPQAEWILADACELVSLQEADLAGCDVVVAATGARAAYLMRFGIGALPTASTLLQDGDQVFMLVTDDMTDRVTKITAAPPEGSHS